METQTKKRFWVGFKAGRAEAFKCAETPTEDTHGKLYAACMGPFRTRRAAIFVVEHGQGNPHIQTVADAERIAKRYAKQS